MSYATPDELAAALRVTVTAKNQELLQFCVDAASREIDHYCDRHADDPIPDGDPLAHMVCLGRGVEHYKVNDVAWGAIGFEGVGVIAARPDTFGRHAATLTPLKQNWAVA
jgi:hypothetical protein